MILLSSLAFIKGSETFNGKAILKKKAFPGYNKANIPRRKILFSCKISLPRFE
jgi:hypothetical protein